MSETKLISVNEKNYVCTADDIIANAMTSMPTKANFQPLESKRDEYEWKYRELHETCWQQTFDKVIKTFSITPTNEEIRNIMNTIYQDWERKNRAKNDRTREEMINVMQGRYRIEITPQKSNLKTPIRPSNKPTLGEIQQIDLINIHKNMDALERLELASRDIYLFTTAINKAIEYLQMYRKPTYNICRIWFNSFEILKTQSDTMTNERNNYACDVLESLEKAIYDCGGNSMIGNLQKGEYKYLFPPINYGETYC